MYRAKTKPFLSNTLTTAVLQLRNMTGQSRGAIAGGFSRENLLEWANGEWGEKESQQEHYVDLFSHIISAQCAANLENHTNPSSAAGRALFLSRSFAIERAMLSLTGKNTALPEDFQKGSNYLMFSVAEITPHELIFHWQTGQARGCTMLAMDPRARRVYLGSGLEASPFLNGALFQRVLLPFHRNYSNWLLRGMVQELEREHGGDR